MKREIIDTDEDAEIDVSTIDNDDDEENKHVLKEKCQLNKNLLVNLKRCTEPKRNENKKNKIDVKPMHFKCNYCHDSFDTEKELDVHYKSNYQYFEYRCPYCKFIDDKATSIKVMSEHQKFFHTDRINYSVTIVKYCYEFSNAKQTNKHRFYCPNCPVSFLKISKLKSHKKNECGLKYTCLMCQKSFDFVNEVYKHVLDVHRSSN